MQIQRVDCDFLKTYNINLIAGRFFSESRTSDLNKSYVINETAMKAMGMKSAVDKKFSLWGQRGKIIGVIKDFHFKSLHNKIEPVVLWLNTTRNFSGFKYLTLRVKSNSISNTIKVVESIFKKHSPDYPFEYSFFDESLGKLYKSEKRLSKIFNFFTLLAIFISCLGLFALVAFLVEQKTKEIGVRKVLGSTVGNIVGLLLKSFMKWIIIANIIAWPIAYYAMSKWLTGFAYRIDIAILPFLLSGILALIIAMVTVGFQAIKAARANPVESLKYE
jgi:putative ABC transport system permease protein